MWIIDLVLFFFSDDIILNSCFLNCGVYIIGVSIFWNMLEMYFFLFYLDLLNLKLGMGEV